VISRSEVPNLLTEAVPSFAESELWREYWQDYEAEPEPLDFLLVSAFVRHLSLRLASGHRDDMEAAMELTERLIADGESYVHNLAVVGILEDLQNSTVHSNGVSPSDFETCLRPWSRWWWEEVHLFWAGKIPRIGLSGRPRPSGMPDPAAPG
jgi:hypothetical protein